MLGTPIVSIITPVYNAVSYLGRAVASVKAQTLEDWELILVDDGSTDGSAKAIDRLALEERRIRPVHQVNSGPARARNVAVTHARGRYLAFMDSDDTVSPEWLERMVREADEREADMVMCNYRTVNASGLRRESHHGFTCGRVMSPEMLKEEVLMRYFRRASVGVPSLWTKLIRSEWLKKAGVTMPENRVRAEDWLFILRCLETDTPLRFSAINDVLYDYWQNEGSIMHTVREGEWRQYFESRDILLLVNERHQLGCERDVISSCVASAVECLVRLYRMRPFRRGEGRRTDVLPRIFKDIARGRLEGFTPCLSSGRRTFETEALPFDRSLFTFADEKIKPPSKRGISLYAKDVLL